MKKRTFQVVRRPCVKILPLEWLQKREFGEGLGRRRGKERRRVSYLLSAFYIPDVVLSPFCALIHLILIETLWCRCYYFLILKRSKLRHSDQVTKLARRETGMWNSNPEQLDHSVCGRVALCRTLWALIKVLDFILSSWKAAEDKDFGRQRPRRHQQRGPWGHRESWWEMKLLLNSWQLEDQIIELFRKSLASLNSPPNQFLLRGKWYRKSEMLMV